MKNLVIVILAAVLIGAAIFLATSMQAPQGESVTSAQSGQNTTAAPAASSAAVQSAPVLNYDSLMELVASLDKTQRDAVLADAQLFSEMLRKEALRNSFIQAANASSFANDSRIQYLLARQSDDFLVNTYINSRLQAAGVPEGFPSDEQIKQFYDSNRDQFRLGERLPVWQIFWRVARDASKTDSARLLKQASKVSTQLRKGSISFAKAAATHSQHSASSLNGGFMGILLTADLKADIKSSLLALKEGSVSKPVRGENGIHIFMRGALLPEKDLPLDQVRSKVAEALLQALRAQQRQQLQNLVQEQYPPATPGDQQMAEWRQRVASFYKQNPENTEAK